MHIFAMSVRCKIRADGIYTTKALQDALFFRFIGIWPFQEQLSEHKAT